MALPNLHASAVVLGDRGLVVAGPSGSGKTSLCLALLEHCRAAGVFARLVSDDQILLQRAGTRLIARAPGPIAGLVEVHGFRPSPIRHAAAAVVDAMVRLVPPGDVPRFSEVETEMLAGCPVPRLPLPAGNAPRGVAIVGAWLGLPSFERLPAENSPR